jgi:hypothetical protein
MRVHPFAICFFIACGAVAGFFVSGLVPAALREPHLQADDFVLSRKADDLLEITPARWFFWPFLSADFDLRMDVELAEGADLDMLVRQVEPRITGDELKPFTGRFSVLRMSTIGDGPGWRTREEALFGPRHGGVGLAAGQPATVWLQARGRMLRANVAGRWQPWFEAADEYGMTTLMARGGKVVLRNFTIENRGQPRAWIWARTTWIGLGALAAAAVAAVALMLGERQRWFFAAGLAAPLLTWVMTRGAELQLGWPAPGSMSALLAAGLLATGAGLRAMRGMRCVPWLASTVLLCLIADRQLARDDRAVEAVFGVDAGSTLSECHGQLVRCPDGLHDLDGPRPRVFLLGGQLLYDRGQPGDHLALRLGSDLRVAKKKKVDVACLPTVDGHTQQQWRLFTTCLARFCPDVIVFGVPRDEAANDAHTGRPRSDAVQLRQTLAAVLTHCRANAARLVVFTEAQLPAELMLIVREIEQEGVPVVVAGDGVEPAAVAHQLSAAVLSQLR